MPLQDTFLRGAFDGARTGVGPQAGVEKALRDYLVRAALPGMPSSVVSALSIALFGHSVNIRGPGRLSGNVITRIKDEGARGFEIDFSQRGKDYVKTGYWNASPHVSVEDDKRFVMMQCFFDDNDEQAAFMALVYGQKASIDQAFDAVLEHGRDPAFRAAARR